MAVCSSIYKGQIGERKRASTSFFFFSRRKNETKMKSFTECSSVPEYQDRMANKKKKKKKEMCPGSQFESISFLASATVHLNQSGDPEPLWGIPISAAYNPLNETYFIFRRKGHTRHPSRWPQKLSWKYNVKKKMIHAGFSMHRITFQKIPSDAYSVDYSGPARLYRRSS